MNREELEAGLAEITLVEKLDVLKAKVRDGDRSEKTLAAFKAAKLALYEARQVLRAGRVPVAETVAVTTEGG